MVRNRHRGAIQLENDRVGGRRNDEREGGHVYHPLSQTEDMMRNTHRRDYGNDAPMEITKRFPQPLGNLAQEREIPTFPQPIIFVSEEKSVE